MKTSNNKQWAEVGTFVWYVIFHVIGAWAISSLFHVPFPVGLATAFYIKFLINDAKA